MGQEFYIQVLKGLPHSIWLVYTNIYMMPIVTYCNVEMSKPCISIVLHIFIPTIAIIMRLHNTRMRSKEEAKKMEAYTNNEYTNG